MRGNPIFRFLKLQLEAGNLGQVMRIRLSNGHSGSLKGWFDTEGRWMADLEQSGVSGCAQPDQPEPWPHAFDLFLDAITGKEAVPLVPARQAVYRNLVMAALYTAAR